MPRTGWWCLLAVTVAAALSASGCGGSGDNLSAPIYSAAVAKTEAERLADIPLPRRTERVPSPPSSAAKLLQRSRNTERYAREQIQTRYWLTSERPEPLLAFIKANAPQRHGEAHRLSIRSKGRSDTGCTCRKAGFAAADGSLSVHRLPISSP
jgi:hypothetical protein